MKRFALLAMLALCGCAGRSPSIYPVTPKDITEGKARLLVYAPDVVKVSYPWETEVMLVGRATAYPQRIYLLIFSTEGRKELFSVAPAVQRYYSFKMHPFDRGFYPRDGVIVMTVSLHELRGFNFLGQPQPGPAWLYDIRPIRYTYSLEAQIGSR